jgi:glucokinase
MLIVGLDIGGTKCASLIAETDGGAVKILSRAEFATRGSWGAVLDGLCDNVRAQLRQLGSGIKDVGSVGISCGGPLDGRAGLILSPPNLPGWDNVPVSACVAEKLGVKSVGLMNDADACAVAEYRFGAGRGHDNVIFLTFGTGLGAGLILNGALYTGASNMAGEVGHIRLQDDGAVGYGKRGSFEGLCSGGGIAQQIRTYFTEKLQRGIKSPLCPDYEAMNALTVKDLGAAADAGDRDALAIFAAVGRNFGRGLSVLVDILNPDVIIAGGIFMRCRRFIEPAMTEALQREALGRSLSAVKFLPAALGEQIGDFGAIAAAPL